jgi:hypothetical protein
MIGYFVLYPWLRARRGFTANLREVNLPTMHSVKIEFNKIKNSGQIFTDSFTFYQKHLRTLGLLSAVLAFVYTTALMLMEVDFDFRYSSGILFMFEAFPYTAYNISQFLFMPNINPQWMMNVLGVAIMAYFTLYRISALANKEKRSTGYHIQTAVSALVISGFINGLLLFSENGFFIFVFIVFVFPLLILWLSNIFNEGSNLLNGFLSTFRYLAGNWATMMGAYIVMLLMCYVFLFLTTAPILNFFSEMILTMLPFSDVDAALFHQAFSVFVQAFILCFLFPLVFTTLSIAQFSFKETMEANELFEQIPLVGNKKRSYGMERENNLLV